MERPWTAATVLMIATICAVFGANATPAQQFSSGSAATTISTSAPTTTNAVPAGNEGLHGLTFNFNATTPELSQLEEADRAHSESTRRLQTEYRLKTDAEERKKLSEELERVITEHFEIRQKIRAQELEELQAQIRRLQDLHNRREQEKSQIISDYLRQLLRNADGLGWGSSDAGTSSLGMPGARYNRPVRSVAPATTINPPR